MKYNSSAYWPVVRSMIKWSDNTVLRNYFVKTQFTMCIVAFSYLW